MKRFVRSLAILAVAGSSAGCALFPKAAAWVDFKSVQSAETGRFTREDGYYASAVAAIARRDYATALDLLQAARAAKPDDVRVLNAFGVVYDKLGRFDLSARYYEQAERLDPGSPILARNITYSASLQTKVAAPLLLAQAPAPAQVAPVMRARPAVVKLALAPPTIMAKMSPGQTGRPLEVADLSGQAGGAQATRAALLRLGWSVGEVVADSGGRQAKTTIIYNERNALVAQALQRTLPGPASLKPCADCAGVRLALGADAVRWSWPARGEVSRGD
jgi:tetratricopeptide (TPR) repeat protein